MIACTYHLKPTYYMSHMYLGCALLRDEKMLTTRAFLLLLTASLFCANTGATTDNQLVQVQFYGEAL